MCKQSKNWMAIQQNAIIGINAIAMPVVHGRQAKMAFYTSLHNTSVALIAKNGTYFIIMLPNFFIQFSLLHPTQMIHSSTQLLFYSSCFVQGILQFGLYPMEVTNTTCWWALVGYCEKMLKRESLDTTRMAEFNWYLQCLHWQCHHHRHHHWRH